MFPLIHLYNILDEPTVVDEEYNLAIAKNVVRELLNEQKIKTSALKRAQSGLVAPTNRPPKITQPPRLGFRSAIRRASANRIHATGRKHTADTSVIYTFTQYDLNVGR